MKAASAEPPEGVGAGKGNTSRPEGLPFAGIPPEIAQIVQTAYADMAKDPEFLADVAKTGFDTGYLSPTDIQDSVVKLLQDESMKTTLKRILG